jgi:signal transduction histidine kinase
VAVRWRIRHKLLVGFGLVVAIMGLLLAGTLNGLLTFTATMKTIESKLQELNVAKEFVYYANNLLHHETGSSESDDYRLLMENIKRAESKLAEYQDTLKHTIERQRDPDQGAKEIQQILVVNQSFSDLKKAIATFWQQAREGDKTTPLFEDEHVKKCAAKLALESSDLSVLIHDRIIDRIKEAQSSNRENLAIVISTCVLGILLMAGLLRTFYGWVFSPIGELQQGAGRLAQGDFDNRIEVHSGDEMEDLAAAFNDMTGRLQEMYRDLEHQVNERSRQLVRSERLASVGFLAAGVAHEINNPLASIAFCSEALESRISEVLHKTGADGGTVLKYLKMIQDEAFRCKNITQKLLEFSRGNERRRESTDLGQMIQSVLEMVQHLQNSKGKQIVFEPTRRVSAWINAQEIKSVVLNLVVNALESMDEGGVLTITLGARNQRAEMTFADTGCGMSQEILDNIFEPFFTKSRTGKGTGLGLSISHRAITQHGGEIEATSPGPDQGSTFTVRLPMFPAEAIKEDTLGHAAA